MLHAASGRLGAARSRRSLDDCGLRFVRSASAHLAHARRARRRAAELPAKAVMWAVLSEAKDALLPALALDAPPTWRVCCALGVGFWMQSVQSLHALAEQLADVQ